MKYELKGNYFDGGFHYPPTTGPSAVVDYIKRTSPADTDTVLWKCPLQNVFFLCASNDDDGALLPFASFCSVVVFGGKRCGGGRGGERVYIANGEENKLGSFSLEQLQQCCR